MKTVLTYGTFDVLHAGHINILRRARALGDRLIVGLSTDAFNAKKHKDSLQSYVERKMILESLRYVDRVIPERTWTQKRRDILRYHADVLVMGSDWKGQFDELKKYCDVVYLSRTPHVSSTRIRLSAASHFIRST